MERWKGSIAVVTGSSAGIGAAVAEALVNSGLEVVGLARRKDRVEALSKRLAFEGKQGKLYAIQTDVSKEEDVVNAFKWIKENLGPISILVNSAGVLRPTTFADGEFKMWKEVLDTNVLGLCVATREAIRDMRANNTHGQIIHINSIFGHKVPPVPYFNMYPVSKFAITALTETLRQELNMLQSKIKISSISPGACVTEILNTEEGSQIQDLKKFCKNSPVLPAEDVAQAVLYVLSTPPHLQIHDIIMKPLGEVH